MTPIQQLFLGTGSTVATKTYVDDCFYSHVYEGNSSTSGQNITGSDFTPDLVWIKGRNHTANHILVDSVRGNDKVIYSNTSDDEDTNEDYVNSRFEGGFKVGNSGITNGSNETNVGWTWKKQEGFFDVVQYTGNETNRIISHNLGCIPGLILIKCTSVASDWTVYHRALGSGKALILNNTDGESVGSTYFNDTDPTASGFTLGTRTVCNGNGRNYIAYLFAGGESTAATARSVDFDGNDSLSISDSSDFDLGSGNWTIEGWIKVDGLNANGAGWLTQWVGGQYSWYFGTSNGNSFLFAYSTTGSNIVVIDSGYTVKDDGQYHHYAVTRSGNTTYVFVDGVLVKTDNTNYTINNSTNDVVIGNNPDVGSGWYLDGKISNLRLVKGTAVYTSSFRPPTEPLTNITNTKLLCCNDSSTTGSSVTPGTITANGDPTASTDSPFDDPAGFVFGESGSESVIKCGSYVGNGSTDGPEINLGWEPQYILIKRSSAIESWMIFDAMRGMTTQAGNDHDLRADLSNGEGDVRDYIDITPTGFKQVNTQLMMNGNGSTYIYMCIRRSDGYVGKPPELGTDVFAMDTGNSSSSGPAFDANFAVDFALNREFAGGDSWATTTRLTGRKWLRTNSNDPEESAHSNYYDDYNNGWSISMPSNYQSWMWKRHAGLDVVCYPGREFQGRQIPHSLSKIPEIIMVKKRSSGTENWAVYHKGLNGGTNPEQYYMRLNTSDAEIDNTFWYDNAPSSTHFSVGFTHPQTNQDDKDYLAMLFASVDGISKVGSYTGTGSSGNTITTGFQPRFVIIKNTSRASTSWTVLDTLRGWGSGDDKSLELNDTQAQETYNYGAPTSTGFTLDETGNWTNRSNDVYIYYAHA